jgi:hypothetical protein
VRIVLTANSENNLNTEVSYCIQENGTEIVVVARQIFANAFHPPFNDLINLINELRDQWRMTEASNKEVAE